MLPEQKLSLATREKGSANMLLLLTALTFQRFRPPSPLTLGDCTCHVCVWHRSSQSHMERTRAALCIKRIDLRSRDAITHSPHPCVTIFYTNW
ncbi:hypothetical protein Mp_5g06770 [Marchantia polymorpha subsp. ruderalis]|uniref:Uncharacterized protein n=2 Tax=Marchantia polymorpha TaxID=3197 RepID=A0AAF6BFP6_MARPO|nr:hypothetical protein MARPO_0171s0005 [Marchantia polymorpha]BBN10830.1 hypothetical protein Mp_5g06770 [Marchantia polymorpha subsp. ruderalis]|eukprot:PTQ28162.1 hypothetical protein MARPO_0171s0005 [Marchantia polymorpha]